VASKACVSIFKETALVGEVVGWERHGILGINAEPAIDCYEGDIIFTVFNPPMKLSLAVGLAFHRELWISHSFLPGTYQTDTHESDMTLNIVSQKTGAVLMESDRWPDLD
jgi:hypothetical protein